ncbi:MAG: efflux RND transporter periplasmic adaptor subunit [Spirochaetales bacterium]|nr:efflux RND transporter periplasmic adaptor subunit [Spirochaetales bacterium]
MNNFPSRKKKIIFALSAGLPAALVIAAVALFASPHKTPEEQPAEGPPVSVQGGEVTLSEKARRVSGLQTARAALRNISKNIKTTGKVVMNEKKRSYITSRVEGRLEVLYIASEGEYIQTGQELGAVYSPAYIAAQEEFLLALRAGKNEDGKDSGSSLLEAARRKLKLLNVTDKDILELESSGKPKDLMPLYAQFSGIVLERQVLPGAYIRPGDRLFSLIDLSTVWINVDIYEKDLAGVKVNQEARITSGAYPGETFMGRVVFVNPVLDDATRTVKARVEMDNREGKLKPNMFVSASLRVPLGESLVIPESAVLDYGEEQLVFLEKNESAFVKRAVTAGQYANGYVQILSGLEAGETVVTAAAFLLDSQTKLGGFAGHGGHGGGHN